MTTLTAAVLALLLVAALVPVLVIIAASRLRRRPGAWVEVVLWVPADEVQP